MQARALDYSFNYLDMAAAPELILVVVASMSMSVPVLLSLQHHHVVRSDAAASCLGRLPPSDKNQTNF